MSARPLTGRCMCGAVSFRIDGEPGESDACHCEQCRRQSGHYFASVNVPRASLQVTGAERITWYRSSERVRRGFCSACGSALFWDPPPDRDWTSVAMGALDAPTGLHLQKHIFVAEKGDYYAITDGLPQLPR